MKCDSRSCCSTPSRIDYKSFTGSRFLPPPIPLKITKKCPAVYQDGNFGTLFQNLWLSRSAKKAVFDAYCPSMNKIKHRSGLTELERRTCNCGAYYQTLVALHLTSHTVSVIRRTSIQIRKIAMIWITTSNQMLRMQFKRSRNLLLL